MKTYESIFILRSNLGDDEVSKIIEKMKGVVEKNDGTVLKTENWGKRKLAYHIQKEKKGTYIILNLKGSGKVIEELERNFRVEDSVIKFLTVKVPEVIPVSKNPPAAEEGRTSPRSRPAEPANPANPAEPPRTPSP